MYYIYILKSLTKDRYYIGHTDDLKSRLERHNFGKVRGSRNWKPWQIVYKESYSSRGEAMKRESKLKSWKNKNMLNELISRGGGTVTSEAS